MDNPYTRKSNLRHEYKAPYSDQGVELNQSVNPCAGNNPPSWCTEETGPCDGNNPPAWCNDATIPIDPGVSVLMLSFIFGILLLKSFSLS